MNKLSRRSSFFVKEKSGLFIIAVLTVLVQATRGQSFLLTVGQIPRTFESEDDTFVYSITNKNRSEFHKLHSSNSSEEDSKNSTIILIENTVVGKPNELSQTAMDIITIVWYVATFLALAAFFMLMACSDRRCNETQRGRAGNGNQNEGAIAPPTPSPSYSEFAPPSYETVMKMQQHAPKTSIFVIPFTQLESGSVGVGMSANINNNNNSNINDNGHQTPQTPTTTPVTFYTVNELHKLGS